MLSLTNDMAWASWTVVRGGMERNRASRIVVGLKPASLAEMSNRLFGNSPLQLTFFYHFLHSNQGLLYKHVLPAQ